MSNVKTNNLSPFSTRQVQINGQGVYLPSLTTSQRDAIVSPQGGLLIYNSDTQSVEHYNGSSAQWESTDGIQSLNGVVAKVQLLTIGTSGVSPNITQSGGNTNTINIPNASSSGVAAGLLSHGDYTSFATRLFPTKNIKYVVKNTTLGPQDYNTVSDALASITDEDTVTNPYIIKVISPGVYIEQQIVLRPGIFVTAETLGCTLVPFNPDEPFIIGSDNSSVSNLVIFGATGPNGIGVQYTSQGIPKSAFLIDSCIFGDSTKLVRIYGNPTANTIGYMSNCFSTNGVDFTTGVSVESSPGDQLSVLVASNVLLDASGTSNTHGAFFNVSGNTSAATIRSCTAIGSAFTPETCTGLSVSDGASCTLISTDFAYMGTVIHVPNVGSGPLLSITACHAFATVDKDLLIEHPSTSGNINGSFSIANSVVDSSNLNLFNTDPKDGITFTGRMAYGPSFNEKTDVTDIILEGPAMGVYDGGEISEVSGLTISVNAGNGYVMDFSTDRHKHITWDTTNLTLTTNSVNYIFFNFNGILSTSGTMPDTRSNILLGRVVTNDTGIELTDTAPLVAHHYGNLNDIFIREAIGPVFRSGCTVTENSTTPLHLDISQGVYFFGNNRISPSGGTNVSLRAYYRNGSGGWNRSSVSAIDNQHYDDGSGTLAAIPSGKYAKHSVRLVGEGSEERHFLIYSQNIYSTLVEAENGGLPTPPEYFNDGVVRIASIIVSPDSSTIVEIRDERARIGFNASNTNSALIHGNLLGLTADDHKQYLLANGSRAMSGNLDMGGNNVVNVGTVDGVTVHAHASRHLPNGADPIATSAPSSNLSAITANSVGIANSLARSDHSHSISTAAASTQLPDQANAAGSSPSLARADHIHSIATAAPSGSVGANNSNSQGISTSFSRSDHAHAVATAAPTTQLPDQLNAVGSSNNLARADHIHAIPTGVPVDIGSSNSQGSASAFSRQDHVHKGIHSFQVNGGTQRFGDINLKSGVGVTVTDNGDNSFTFDTIDAASEFVVSAGSGLVANYTAGKAWFAGSPVSVTSGSITLTASQTNWFVYLDVDGVVKNAAAVPPNAIALAKFTTSSSSITSISDVREQVNHNTVFGTSGDIVTIVPDASAAAGSTNKHADAGHTHAIATAAAVGLSAATTNTQGSAVTFAKSDHTHALATGNPVTQTPDQVNAAGTSSNLARADHVHNIATAAAVGLSATTSNAQGSAVTFAKSDHTHALATGNPVTQTPDQVNATGVSANLARADHIHNIPTASAVGLNAGSTSAQGSALSFAKSDHTHAIASGAASTQTPDQANAAGSSTNFARADHVHDIPTAAASSISTSTTNTQGSAASFARSDHTHAISITNSRVSSSTLISNTSTTDVLMTGMSITPPAGTYHVTSRVIVGATSNNRLITMNLYAGGTIVTDSEVSALVRTGGTFESNADQHTLYTDGVVTVNGSQAIEMRWRTSGGTAQASPYALNLNKLS